jgi:hypothetical protein
LGYDASTAERIRRLLAGRSDVVEQKMVGGRSFLVNGRLSCGVTGTALMIRVGPEARARALTQPHVRPMLFGRRPLAGFVCVDPAGFPTDAELEAWVKQGIDFASTLPDKGS